jgi:hypothetical protein
VNYVREFGASPVKARVPRRSSSGFFVVEDDDQRGRDCAAGPCT